MKVLNLTYVGMDSWDRPVYKDENGQLWKDVIPNPYTKANLCTCVDNKIEGEPDINMSAMKEYEDVKINYIPTRITW